MTTKKQFETAVTKLFNLAAQGDHFDAACAVLTELGAPLRHPGPKPTPKRRQRRAQKASGTIPDRIATLLREEGEKSVKQITKELKLKENKYTSNYLNIMKNKGIVQNHRDRATWSLV